MGVWLETEANFYTCRTGSCRCREIWFCREGSALAASDVRRKFGSHSHHARPAHSVLFSFPLSALPIPSTSTSGSRVVSWLLGREQTTSSSCIRWVVPSGYEGRQAGLHAGRKAGRKAGRHVCWSVYVVVRPPCVHMWCCVCRAHTVGPTYLSHMLPECLILPFKVSFCSGKNPQALVSTYACERCLTSQQCVYHPSWGNALLSLFSQFSC